MSQKKQKKKLMATSQEFMELIRERAYRKFLERGDRAGSKEEDWYNAEQELLAEYEIKD